MNHPAGRIGKRLTLRVADVMLAGPDALPLVSSPVTVSLRGLRSWCSRLQACCSAGASGAAHPGRADRAEQQALRLRAGVLATGHAARHLHGRRPAQIPPEARGSCESLLMLV